MPTAVRIRLLKNKDVFMRAMVVSGPSGRVCLGLVVVVLAMPGCAVQKVVPLQYPSRSMSAEEAYARAEAVFPRAVLYKPRDPSGGMLDASLAPLIVQEVADLGPNALSLSGFGLVFTAYDGRAHVDASQPTVYVDRRTGFVGGEIRQQVLLAWCHEVTLFREMSTVVCRGLRMTYDTEGYPLAWEVLDPALEADVVFVSDRVETKAGERYGTPVEGCRHHVERLDASEQRTIVARVIDDGPMPMGPYIYLDARRGEVASVLCRCMASQVKEFVATTYYQEVPFTELGKIGRSLLSGKAALSTRLRWPDGLQ